MKTKLLAVSLITLTCLYGALAGILIFVCLCIDVQISYAITAAIIAIIIQFLIAPVLNDFVFKHFYQVNWNAQIPDYLKKFITDTCNKHNMKYPKIGLINDGTPNAFTYGRTKNDARVVITKGILELLNEEEVKSVVAHELGHANHYDMLFMTAVQIVPLILYHVYELLLNTNSNKSSKSSSKNDNNIAIVGLIAFALYIISQYIILWLSRTREYYADSFSIEETKNPNALASALVKIGYGLSMADTTKKHSVSKTNALGIFDSKTSKSLVISSMDDGQISKDNIKNAMKWEEWNVWAKWYELNSTHPLISKRLLAISSRSEEFNQTPYITFDLKKEESYIDDFLIEVLISFLPTLSLLIGILITAFLYTKGQNYLKPVSITLLITIVLSYVKFRRKYSSSPFTEKKVKDLLGEVKVSHITSVPCTLEGKIIGRGNPGCIFNEDFVIQDDTGIMFLDYNQPLAIINKIFALFKSKEYFEKNIKIKGWYRRSPVPYVEIKTMEIDGKEKKVFTYYIGIALHIIIAIISIVLFSISL